MNDSDPPQIINLTTFHKSIAPRWWKTGRPTNSQHIQLVCYWFPSVLPVIHSHHGHQSFLPWCPCCTALLSLSHSLTNIYNNGRGAQEIAPTRIRGPMNQSITSSSHSERNSQPLPVYKVEHPTLRFGEEKKQRKSSSWGIINRLSPSILLTHSVTLFPAGEVHQSPASPEKSITEQNSKYAQKRSKNNHSTIFTIPTRNHRTNRLSALQHSILILS